MAWPHFMHPSFPSANLDHTPKPSAYFFNATADIQGKNGVGSVGMNNHIPRNLYEGETAGPALEVSGGAKGPSCNGSGFREVTLEDYLTKARVTTAEEAKEAAASVDRIGVQMELEESGSQMVGIGGGEDGVVVALGGGERGRGRKRPAVDSADRAAMQRQKRMIKNRESAARSRERKQQYTNQLEQTVFKLEEENALLLKERDELLNWRFKQLIENATPVSEQKMPKKVLRRSNSCPLFGK